MKDPKIAQQLAAFKTMFKSDSVKTTLGVIAGVGIMVGIAASIGALVGLALGTSLPPLIAGGTVGFMTELLSVAIFFSLVPRLINKCINFIDELPVNTLSQKENKEALKKYFKNFTEYKINYAKCTISIGISFGIGVGLAAIGFTSPAAIGALTVIIGPVVCYPLFSLLDKAIECFSSKEPNGSLNEKVNVEGSHNPLQV